MEPFEIRSTPARIGPGSLVAMAVVILVAAYLLVESCLQLYALTLGDREVTVTRVAVLAGVLALTWVVVALALPQALILRRYFAHDRGKQVVTFRLDQDGWHWLQTGTRVVLPWDGRDHYLAGVYRTALATRADELVAQGRRSMRALVETADTQRVVMDRQRALVNVNSPTDFI